MRGRKKRAGYKQEKSTKFSSLMTDCEEMLNYGCGYRIIILNTAFDGLPSLTVLNRHALNRSVELIGALMM